MNDFAIRLIILAASIYLVGKLTRLFHVKDFLTAIIAALLLALVNLVVRPVLIILTIPLTILTFGLFLFFINGFMLLLVSKLVPTFKVYGCFTAALSAFLISLVNLFLHRLLP